MTFRERLQWIFRMALLLFILSSIGFLSALTAMRFAIQGREVTMPDLVGSSANKARSVLRGRSLGLKVEDRIYTNLPVDAVVRQSPLPNTRVKTGQYAHVILSLGSQKLTVPTLQDKSLRAAQVELLRGGMQLGEVSSVHLPDDGDDIVIEQSPAPGTLNATSPHVDLLVSLGAEPSAFVMPDFSGMSAAQAESELAVAGLKVAKITPVAGSQLAPGTVAGQSPARGQRVDSDSVIDLQVSQ
jgi:eukaryotic-like serine/threonine-protein kinase